MLLFHSMLHYLFVLLGITALVVSFPVVQALDCATNNGGCEHQCLVERGIGKCVCNTGYSLTSNGLNCEDDDECNTGAANCQHDCTNSQGSFKCECNPGYTLDSDGRTCMDNDECLANKCEQGCVNTLGAFHCSCAVGYQLNIDRQSCADVDECRTNNGGCSHICSNSDGRFSCQCPGGHRLNSQTLACEAIDECSENVARCSQICIDTSEGYDCNCRIGYGLAMDRLTCTDINECQGVTCYNGGVCVDHIGSYSCSCQAGFTGKHCEHDIDECSAMVNGGCEDTCINTVGSFKCSCSGQLRLQSNGYLCSGNGTVGNAALERAILGVNILKGCFTVQLPACSSNSNARLIMSSTAPWYQHKTNSQIMYTHGITFVEIGHVVIPVSIYGMYVKRDGSKLEVDTGSNKFRSSDGNLIGSERASECLSSDITPRDVYTMMQSNMLIKWLFRALENILPEWIEFLKPGSEIHGIHDMKTNIRKGADVQASTCQGAPLSYERLYVVMTFKTSFLIEVYGHKIVLPESARNKQYCLILDICQESGGSVFLILPEGSRDIFDNMSIFKRLSAKFGLRIRPSGVGLSLSKDIMICTKTPLLNLWNGVQQFQPPVTAANIWIGGGADLEYGVFRLAADTNAYISLPGIQSLLKNVIQDEWEALLTLQLTANLEFRVNIFNKQRAIALRNVGNAQLEAYSSFGGSEQRQMCGQHAHPPGFFVSLMVKINPFENIPILRNILHFDINSRVYAYIQPNQDINHSVSSVSSILRHIIDCQTIVRNFLHITLKSLNAFSQVLDANSLKIVDDIRGTTERFENILEPVIRDLTKLTIHNVSDISNRVAQIWSNGWKQLENDVKSFISSVHTATTGIATNITHVITTDIDKIKDKLDAIVQITMNMPNSLTKDVQGFGFRYLGHFNLFELLILDLEIEFVYSEDSLGSCSRFRKVFELFKGERAFRFYGELNIEKMSLGPFIKIRKSEFSIHLAVSLDTPGKLIAMFHAKAKFLGILFDIDVLVSNKGLYFFAAGTIFETYKAELNVSAEHGKDWNDLRLSLDGRFSADADGDGNFNDGYVSSLTKFTDFIADEADKRISKAQDSINHAKQRLTDAQNWLEDKKSVFRNAKSKFDDAIRAMERAKDKLEAAKAPFRAAQSKLDEAQRKVDNICRIRSCRKICVPGLACSICWKKIWFAKIPYPCCHTTSCMFSFPDPICLAANAGCAIVRGVAWVALEAAKLAVKIPMAALDVAKAAVSVAQFVVDKSKVVLDIAIGALDLAKFGLEGAKTVLDGVNLALEAVKRVVRLGLRALNFVIKNGLAFVADIRNCGFGIVLATEDTSVLDIHCELNLFKSGFREIHFMIDFSNIIQSLWNAAKATINRALHIIGDIFSGRKRREIQHETLQVFHSSFRETRNIDTNETHYNDTLDVIFETLGYKNNRNADSYESKREIFNAHYKTFSRVYSFIIESLFFLLDIVKERLATLDELRKHQRRLRSIHIDTNLAIEQVSVESLGINTDTLADFNLNKQDVANIIANAKLQIQRDEYLRQTASSVSEAHGILESHVNSVNNINLMNIWILAIDNLTEKYFKRDECILFLDCVHFSVSALYEMYIPLNDSNARQSLDGLSDFEDVFLDLTGNYSLSLDGMLSLTLKLMAQMESLKGSNMFWERPPKPVRPMSNEIKVNVTLFCNAGDDPNNSLMWFKGTTPIEDENAPILIRYNLTERESLKYHCVVGNSYTNRTFDDAEVVIIDDDNRYILGINDENDIDNSADDSMMTTIVGAAAGCLGVLVVGTGLVVWRFLARKRARRGDGKGSVASLNMVRPKVETPGSAGVVELLHV